MEQWQNVKIYTEFNHGYDLPEYAKPGDSGMDIRANQTMIIQPGQTVIVPTGIYLGIPAGYEVQVRPRSGLSAKTKLRIANTPGTVDEQYTGEVGVIVDNIGQTPETINLGDRIAQIVLQKVPKMMLKQVQSRDDLGNTERGSGGFGSTGV